MRDVMASTVEAKGETGGGRIVVHWPVVAAWTLGFVVVRMVLGGYLAPAAGLEGHFVGHVTPLGRGLSFLWVPSRRVMLLVWWPAWLGAFGLGLLLGAAMGVRRTGCCGTGSLWAVRGGGLVAALAGLGCCGVALPATLFAGLAALGQYVRLVDAVMVAMCGWTLYRALFEPPTVRVAGRGRARTLTLFGHPLLTIRTR